MAKRVSQEDLMRYLDDEMPSGERARVDALLAESTELERELAIYRAMHRDLSDLSFTVEVPTSVWGRVNRQITKPVGWLLIIAGGLMWISYGAVLFVRSPADLWEKLGIGAIVIGFVLLLAATIGERYRDWQVDPYKHIQR